MRKLKVSSFVSIDGVTEEPMAIAAGYFDAECRKHARDLLGGVEYFLLGRVSYEMLEGMWSKVKGDPYVDELNAMKKLVASRTRKDVGWNGRLLGADVGGALAEIKRQPGGDILKYGVGNLDRTLLEHRLVDEYHLWIMPRAVGKGKRAFEDVSPQLVTLELTGTRRFPNGVVVLSYACATSQGEAQ